MYAITIVVTADTLEQAERIAADMEEAAGKLNGELDMCDITGSDTP